jgi:predicted negative regulator of RcsB-dependent stress response
MQGSTERTNNKRADFARLLSSAISSIANTEGHTTDSIEKDLGEAIGLSGASIQRYKRGFLPPERRTVEKLAEAGVKRGYLNREWLIRFLRAAHYNQPDPLLNQLCPGVSFVTPERVLHNLPSPPYAQFIMRPQPFNEIVEALKQRTAAVIVASLGGMGKTSLAREVAERCINPQFEGPRFDAAVWVSDAPRPGFTTLNRVLDEIAQTLGLINLLDRNEEEKRRQIEDDLRIRRVLLVVDNFETITDAQLLRWLLTLPEPSKAIITTREYRREFRQGGWPVELGGMHEDEAQAFVMQRMRILRFKEEPQFGQIAPLIDAAGGNPKAIEMALGSLKLEHRPLHDAVNDLQHAQGELFDELFARNWSLLDEAARRMLLAATLFGTSAGHDALSQASDVRGASFNRAVNTLVDLSFVNALQDGLDSPPRYALHPLVRSFAGNELKKDAPFEASARQRWLDWHIQLGRRVGHSRDNLKKLELLDPEREELHAVAAWAREAGLHSKVLQLAEGIGFYCYVRGLLSREPNINLIAAEAARALNKPVDEVEWLSQHLRRMARGHNFAAVEQHLPRIQALAEANALPANVAEDYHHAIASYHVARGQWDKAEQEWRALLYTPGLGTSAKLITMKWLAECCLHKGDGEAARQLLEGTLRECNDGDNARAIVALKLTLAKVLMHKGRIDEAGDLVAGCREWVMNHNIERHAPDVLLLEGRLAALRGDAAAAKVSITSALPLFQRQGLQRELDEAQAALAALA